MLYFRLNCVSSALLLFSQNGVFIIIWCSTKKIHWENPSVHEEPADPLYSECGYEDTCYSIHCSLRVNKESGRELNTSRQPVDNVYEFAHSYTHNRVNGQPNLDVFNTDLIKET